MPVILCSLCDQMIEEAPTPELQLALLDAHGRQYHPELMPWACETCMYVPPGVKGVRCTDIQDGVACMMYRRRPPWLQL